LDWICFFKAFERQQQECGSILVATPPPIAIQPSFLFSRLKCLGCTADWFYQWLALDLSNGQQFLSEQLLVLVALFVDLTQQMFS
jgi:hypothetical protein